MFNKDVTHPKMRRLIKNPRILLLDCPLEYKKGEAQTNVEITNEEDWDVLLRMEVPPTKPFSRSQAQARERPYTRSRPQIHKRSTS